MKFDTTLLVNELSQMPALARAAEAMGFDGIWTSETAHDAFLPLVLAARAQSEFVAGHQHRCSLSPQPGGTSLQHATGH